MKPLATTIVCLALALSAVSTATAQQEPPRRSQLTPVQHDVTIQKLPGGLNSSGDDFAPVLLGNGRVMYFTSDRNGDQDIYSTVSDGGRWSEVTPIGETINTGGDEGGVSVTPDGHWMVFTACDRDDGLGDCDLYIAEHIGGSWRNVRNLGIIINSPEWDSQPSISADGLLLFFASERPGGQGGTDLYMSSRGFGGEWRAPVNLGPRVNTAGDETAPYIAADNRSLYFSSDMLPGIGGMDIYRAQRAGESWNRPEHLGVPINSAYDDYFYCLRLNSDELMFASNRGSEGGDLDLMIGAPNPLPPAGVTTVTGTVRDEQSKLPLGSVLTVRDISSNKVLSSFHSDDVDGGYFVVLQAGRGYVITAEAQGYLFYSDRFDVPAEAMNQMIQKDIDLTRTLVRLLVYFDFNKATLQAESYVDLDRAVDWLNGNPAVKVELAGHTDNVGSPDYNQKLSRERAESVMEYLVGRGVSRSRLRATGFGLSAPVATNETEEGRARNRRVEFRVLSE